MSDHCKRCGKSGADAVCWYCCEPLCSECWEELGHCGHPEAERANELTRAAGSYEERREIVEDAVANGNKETS